VPPNCFKIDNNVRFGVLELDRDSIGALEIEEIYYPFKVPVGVSFGTVVMIRDSEKYTKK
jgi:hypothetical protein